jgi:hypothetical protein
VPLNVFGDALLALFLTGRPGRDAGNRAAPEERPRLLAALA